MEKIITQINTRFLFHYFFFLQGVGRKNMSRSRIRTGASVTKQKQHCEMSVGSKSKPNNFRVDRCPGTWTLRKSKNNSNVQRPKEHELKHELEKESKKHELDHGLEQESKKCETEHVSPPRPHLDPYQTWYATYVPPSWKLFTKRLKEHDYYNFNNLEKMKSWLLRVMMYNNNINYRRRVSWSLEGPFTPLCVLSGPVGCGKTISVKLLAKSLRLNIHRVFVYGDHDVQLYKNDDIEATYSKNEKGDQELSKYIYNNYDDTKPQFWDTNTQSKSNCIIVIDDISGSYDKENKDAAERYIFKEMNRYIKEIFKKKPRRLVPIICITNETAHSSLKLLLKNACHIRMVPRATSNIIAIGRKMLSIHPMNVNLRELAPVVNGDIRTFFNIMQFVFIGKNIRGSYSNANSTRFVPIIFKRVQIMLGMVPLKVSSILYDISLFQRDRARPTNTKHATKCTQLALKDHYLKTGGVWHTQNMIHHNFLFYANPVITNNKEILEYLNKLNQAKDKLRQAADEYNRNTEELRQAADEHNRNTEELRQAADECIREVEELHQEANERIREVEELHQEADERIREVEELGQAVEEGNKPADKYIKEAEKRIKEAKKEMEKRLKAELFILETMTTELEFISHNDVSERLMWKYEQSRVSNDGEDYDSTLGDINTFTMALFYSFQGKKIIQPRCNRTTHIECPESNMLKRLPRDTDIHESYELLRELTLEFEEKGPNRIIHIYEIQEWVREIEQKWAHDDEIYEPGDMTIISQNNERPSKDPQKQQEECNSSIHHFWGCLKKKGIYSAITICQFQKLLQEMKHHELQKELESRLKHKIMDHETDVYQTHSYHSIHDLHFRQYLIMKHMEQNDMLSKHASKIKHIT